MKPTVLVWILLVCLSVGQQAICDTRQSAVLSAAEMSLIQGGCSICGVDDTDCVKVQDVSDLDPFDDCWFCKGGHSKQVKCDYGGVGLHCRASEVSDWCGTKYYGQVQMLYPGSTKKCSDVGSTTTHGGCSGTGLGPGGSMCP
ncbi:MAG: hypothetical protein K6U00_04715 [Armatimonadetes bacterium]|nr:hypothetical protein [Armatimonadota bacterium]